MLSDNTTKASLLLYQLAAKKHLVHSPRQQKHSSARQDGMMLFQLALRQQPKVNHEGDAEQRIQAIP